MEAGVARIVIRLGDRLPIN